MTAFSKTDLPDNVVTLEQLFTWVSLALQSTAGSLAIQEIAGAAPELAIACTPFRIVATEGDYHDRLIVRGSVRFADDWFTRKAWLATEELTATALPAIFRAA